MSDPQTLGEAIEEFLAKYPDNVRMEWRGRGPDVGSDTNPQQVWARDLVRSAERHRATRKDTP